MSIKDKKYLIKQKNRLGRLKLAFFSLRENAITDTSQLFNAMYRVPKKSAK
ncbi:MAG: hypothetical protein GOVbin212_46 [Prokaryotic dsDNA virus sp.]|nr:MAG: hypothetical protein GOVbin212_46 [Prokaryotic dsDNA virus sp.]